MNSKYKNLIKDTLIFAIGNLGSKMILFLLVPLYTNFLSKAEYGTAELVFTVAQLIVPIITVTIWNGIIRFGLMKDKKPEDVIANGIIVWLSGAIITILIMPLLSLYDAISDWRWYLCFYIIAFSLNQIELSYLKVKGKNKQFAGISIIQTFTLALLNIILLVYLKTGVAGYLISNILANFLAAFLLLIVGGIIHDVRKGHYNKQLLNKMLAYSAPLILNDISWWTIHSSDKIMIEGMLSTTELGLYTVASKIPGLVNTFVTIFSQSWGISSIKEIETTNDTMYYSNVFKMYSTIAFGASICFIAIIKPFMHYYVGTDFQEAWRYVPFLLSAAAFSAISVYFGAMYGALKKSVECMWSTVVGGIVNILLNYFCIKAIGTEGAVIGTVVSYFVISIVRMKGVCKYIRIIVDWKKTVLDVSIMLIEALLVTLNYHIFIVAISAVILFAINHYEDMINIFSRIVKRKSKNE